MAGVHRRVRGVDRDLHPFHEPARVVEAVGKGAQVAHERLLVHPGLRRHVAQRVFAAVGERREQVEQPAELLGRRRRHDRASP